MAKKEAEKTKFGAGSMRAFGRQGIAELRNALYADSNVAQRHVEPGMYGTAVSSEIDRQRQEEKIEPAESKDAAQQQAQPAEKELDVERE